MSVTHQKNIFNKEMNKQNKFTRREINTLAKEQKIPYYYDYTKRDLMEKLGVKNYRRMLDAKLPQTFRGQSLTS